MCPYGDRLPLPKAFTVGGAQCRNDKCRVYGRLGGKVGSLEVGKQVDLSILDTKDYREAACEFGSNFVETVIKKGEIISEP